MIFLYSERNDFHGSMNESISFFICVIFCPPKNNKKRIEAPIFIFLNCTMYKLYLWDQLHFHILHSSPPYSSQLQSYNKWYWIVNNCIIQFFTTINRPHKPQSKQKIMYLPLLEIGENKIQEIWKFSLMFEQDSIFCN